MKRILVVDDKVTIGKILSIYLGHEFDLEYCEDPLKAIELLNSGYEPDMIISDIRMPLMSGSEFLHYLKQNALYKDIPVIMLSSEDSTSERIRMLQAGALDYILKPFNPVELKVRVRNILQTW